MSSRGGIVLSGVEHTTADAITAASRPVRSRKHSGDAECLNKEYAQAGALSARFGGQSGQRAASSASPGGSGEYAGWLVDCWQWHDVHATAHHHSEELRAIRRQKHRHAASNVLSTVGITDDVERVHASVGQCGPPDGLAWHHASMPCLPCCPCNGHTCTSDAHRGGVIQPRRHSRCPLVRHACQELTLEQFVERFERPRIPVVITGLTDSWGAGAAWAPTALRARFGEHRFKVSVMHGQHPSSEPLTFWPAVNSCVDRIRDISSVMGSTPLHHWCDWRRCLLQLICMHLFFNSLAVHGCFGRWAAMTTVTRCA